MRNHIQEIMGKWKLHHGLISELAGISRGNFSAKLRRNEFTEDEEEEILKVLQQLARDVEELGDML